MYPVNIDWWIFHAQGYEGHWAFLTLAIGFFYQRYRSLKNGYSNDWFIQAYSFSIFIGFLMARFFHFAFWDTERFFANPAVLFSASGGFAILGGTVGAGLGGYLYCKRTGVNFLHWCDSLMIPIAICLSISRIACFLNGDAYGLPTDSVFGVVFSENSADWMREWKLLHQQYALHPNPLAFLSQYFKGYVNLADIPLPNALNHLKSEGIQNIAQLGQFYPPVAGSNYLEVLKVKGLYPFPVVYPPVHPTQLYECLIMLVVFFILLRLDGKEFFQHKQFFVFWFLYGWNRLLIEVFRGDRNTAIGSLTYAQVISISLIVFAIVGILYTTYQWRNGKPEVQLK